MRLAFTGTQAGMTPAQREAVRAQFPGATAMNNGLCVGADAEALEDFRAWGEWDVWVEGFPANVPGKSRRDLIVKCDLAHPPAPPLVRNRWMVERADKLIAAPREMNEELRSGTWATVRHARKIGRPVVICWPDGTVEATDGR